MKVLVLYFSGTGNTHYVAEYISKQLSSKKKYKVTLSAIEKCNKQEISNYDILFVGFPVYAGNMPVFMQEYIKDIPLTTTKAVYLFCTKGAFSGNAIPNAVKLLQKVGYITMGYAEEWMPGSDGLAFLDKDSKAVEKMTDKDFSKLDAIDGMLSNIDEIFKKPINLEKYKIKVPIKISGLILGGIFKIIYKPMERKFKKKFWVDDSCIQCGLCEKICPSNNIKLNNGKVEFGDDCYLCMRCVHQCPKEAIQIGKGTVGKFRWKGPNNDFKPI